MTFTAITRPPGTAQRLVDASRLADRHLPWNPAHLLMLLTRIIRRGQSRCAIRPRAFAALIGCKQFGSC